MDSRTALRLIRSVHTFVWGVMAGSILTIPVLAWHQSWRWVTVLSALVLLECTVLVANHMRCPLTDLAARYTTDRRDNFDIYLPLWLARYNKILFGWIFAGALAFTLARWQGWLG